MISEKFQWRRIVLMSVICLVVAGCGDEKSQTVTTPAQTAKPSPTVSASEHEAFEKKYLETCIKAQQEGLNDQELGALCQCMAQEISKRLSKADAVHFLEKGEFPFDLVMMTNAAENICSSKKK
jgi:hypothetical protein